MLSLSWMLGFFYFFLSHSLFLRIQDDEQMYGTLQTLVDMLESSDADGGGSKWR